MQGIGPDWLRMMAACNAWQNAARVNAAEGLDGAARTAGTYPFLTPGAGRA